MTPEELHAHDKRQAAHHEAAHLVVAVAQGNRARAYLEPTGASDTLLDKTWTGRVTIEGWGGGPGMSPEIAIAGVVGEVFAEGDDEARHIVDEYLMDGLLDDGGLSPTDLAGLPEDQNEWWAIVERTLDILIEHRAFWTWAVEYLVEN